MDARDEIRRLHPHGEAAAEEVAAISSSTWVTTMLGKGTNRESGTMIGTDEIAMTGVADILAGKGTTEVITIVDQEMMAIGEETNVMAVAMETAVEALIETIDMAATGTDRGVLQGIVAARQLTLCN